jgi:hypothetical protein
LRTGTLPSRLEQDGRIVIAVKTSPLLAGETVGAAATTLGPQEFLIKTMPARHVARGVYEVSFPPAGSDFEYYLSADRKVRWPATAPAINQTVVVLDD